MDGKNADLIKQASLFTAKQFPALETSSVYRWKVKKKTHVKLRNWIPISPLAVCFLLIALSSCCYTERSMNFSSQCYYFEIEMQY